MEPNFQEYLAPVGFLGFLARFAYWLIRRLRGYSSSEFNSALTAILKLRSPADRARAVENLVVKPQLLTPAQVEEALSCIDNQALRDRLYVIKAIQSWPRPEEATRYLARVSQDSKMSHVLSSVQRSYLAGSV